MPERDRARLMLTYRTNITGTPIPQRLPFRLLVLGRFTNALTRRLGVLPGLENRPIHSIDRNRATSGVRIDDFMQLTLPWTTLPPQLATNIDGKLTFGVLNAELGTDLNDQPADVRVHGTATFFSSGADNGTAPLTINDLRVAGTIKIKKDAATGIGLADTKILLKVSGVGAADLVDDPTGKLIAYLDGAAVEVPVTAFAPIAPGEGTTPPRAGRYHLRLKPDANTFDASASRALPLTTMASFSPDAIVANVPALRRLRDSRLELQSLASLSLVETEAAATIDQTIRGHLDAILHADESGPDGSEFARLEANWRGLAELAASVTSDDVIIDFLDVSSDELRADMSDNSADLFGSALFQKVYVDEYDRYGGRPFAAMIGLYAWGSGDEDVSFFKTLMRLCAAAHCPFISSVDASFFGQKSMSEVAALSDLDAVMNQERMGRWRALRDEEWAAYIGLTLPRYLVRLPWDANRPDGNDLETKDNRIGYVETVTPETHDDGLLWGNASILFARNMVRSYESSGWAQHIRGPQGGDTVLLNPVEIAIPDYREYQFARNGLIPLVQKKDEPTATFFSAQSIKRARDLLGDTNTTNAWLVTNLAYTFSTTIIAHYVKATMREYIGSTADGPYIEQVLGDWLSRYVTTVVNPDDLTLLYYPFKATSVSVEPKPGPFGWYKTVIAVLPHAQFEGMDVELRLEAALGGKA